MLWSTTSSRFYPIRPIRPIGPDTTVRTRGGAQTNHRGTDNETQDPPFTLHSDGHVPAPRERPAGRGRGTVHQVGEETLLRRRPHLSGRFNRDEQGGGVPRDSLR